MANEPWNLDWSKQQVQQSQPQAEQPTQNIAAPAAPVAAPNPLPWEQDWSQVPATSNPEINPQPSSDHWEITKGLISGAHSTAASISGAQALVESLVPGGEAAAAQDIKSFQEQTQKATEAMPRINKIEDIHTTGDFVDWAMGTVGQLVPSVATMLAGGGLGGAVGKALAKKSISKYEAELITKGVKSDITAKALQKVAATVGGKAVAKGQLAGAAAASIGLEAGGIYGDVAAQGHTGPAAAAVSLGGGTLAGILDVIPVMNVAKKFGFAGGLSEKIAEKYFAQSAAKRAVKGAVTTGLTEAGTEALQTAIEEGTKAFITDQQLPKNIGSMLINSAAQGLLGGHVMGALEGLAPEHKPTKDFNLTPDEVAIADAYNTYKELDKQLNKIKAIKPETIQVINPENAGIEAAKPSIDKFLNQVNDIQGMENSYLSKVGTNPQVVPSAVHYIKDDTGELTSLDKAQMQPGRTYVQDFSTLYTDQIDYLTSMQLEDQRILDSGTLHPVDHAALQNQINQRKIDIKNIEQKIAQVQMVFPKVQTILNELMKTLGMTSHFVLTAHESASFQLPSLDASSKTDGYSTYYPDQNVHLLGLNLARIVNTDGTLHANFAETVAHEFGHALMDHHFAKLKSKQKTALLAAYRNWLKDNVDGKQTYLKFIQKARGHFTTSTLPEHVTRLYGQLSLGEMLWRTGNIEYKLGLAEFLAHQLERIVAGDTKVAQIIREGFGDMIPELKHVRHVIEKDFGPMPEFSTFMEHLAAKNLYEQMATNLSKEERLRIEEGAVDLSQSILGSIIGGAFKSFPGTKAEANMRGDLDKYNFFYKMAAGLTQLAAENPHIQGLQSYLNHVKNWWNEKMQWTARGDDTLKAWSKYVGVLNRGKRGDLFNQFLLDLTVKSFDGQTRFGPESKEFQDLVQKYKLDEEALNLYARIDKDFQSALNALESSITEHIQRNHVEDPQTLHDQLIKLKKEMQDLRNRNFFPLSRFGKHFIMVRAARDLNINGIDYTKGDTVSFSTFEKKKDASKIYSQEVKKKDFIVQQGVLSDVQSSFSGIPPGLIKMMREQFAQMPGLSEEAKAQLDHELAIFATERAPGQSFKRHLLHRKQTAGYSMDAMRGYANYFMHFSNHIAKIKYSTLMDLSIGDIDKTLWSMQGDASKRRQISDHLKKHMDYILNPGNEFANLRSIGFLYYLGFNVKSAVVNLTQVPLMTYPYLAARYGDAEAVSALGRAMNTFKNLWVKPHKVPVEIHQLLDELRRRGIIDESMATEMAAVAEGSTIQRFAPSWAQNTRAQRYIRTGAAWGSYLFQQAEKTNRRVAAIAAYDLARKKGLSIEEATNAAEDAVGRTQFEYARWNRPFFSQRKRSIFFLFWQYKTNALYFAMKDPGGMRYLTMLMLAAGLSGLPFADDLMDIYNWMTRKLNKYFGAERFPVDVRMDLRNFITELGANPDLAMHGASRYLFGLPKLADMVGIPMANADISGSISMGRMIPGIGGVLGKEGSFQDATTRGAEELGGAVLAIPFNIAKAVADNNSDTLRRVQRVLPTFAKNFSKAWQDWTQQADKTNTGAALDRFDLQDWKQRAEIVEQALGFAPTRTQITKEKFWATKELVTYYESRRAQLLQDFDYARRQGLAAEEEAVRSKIREFNQTIPVRGWRISGQDLVRSLVQRERARRLIERELYTPLRGSQLQRQINKAYNQENPTQAMEWTEPLK